MKQQNFIVLDASPLINVIGSGEPARILNALRRKPIITETTRLELTRNPRINSNIDQILEELIGTEVVVQVDLDSTEIDLFFDLVCGTGDTSLGDGEAAALAVSITRALPIVLDDRKARRVAKSCNPHLEVGSSIDLFIAAQTQNVLPRQALANALFDALQYSRMRVLDDNVPWVRRLLGDERFAKCVSIRRHFRDGVGTNAFRGAPKMEGGRSRIARL